MTADVPEALANEPLSPTLPSQLDTMVPSGMALTGRIFPIESDAIKIIYKLEILIESKHTLGSSVDKLASVHSFDGDEVLNSLLVSVCISEDNLCKWCSSS